jgi:hypothetical protein
MLCAAIVSGVPASGTPDGAPDADGEVAGASVAGVVGGVEEPGDEEPGDEPAEADPGTEPAEEEPGSELDSPEAAVDVALELSAIPAVARTGVPETVVAQPASVSAHTSTAADHRACRPRSECRIGPAVEHRPVT